MSINSLCENSCWSLLRLTYGVSFQAPVAATRPGTSAIFCAGSVLTVFHSNIAIANIISWTNARTRVHTQAHIYCRSVQRHTDAKMGRLVRPYHTANPGQCVSWISSYIRMPLIRVRENSGGRSRCIVISTAPGRPQDRRQRRTWQSLRADRSLLTRRAKRPRCGLTVREFERGAKWALNGYATSIAPVVSSRNLGRNSCSQFYRRCSGRLAWSACAKLHTALFVVYCPSRNSDANEPQQHLEEL